MRGDIQEILISKEQIREKVIELAGRITRDYEGKELVAVCVLKGAVIFYSDLIREIEMPVEMDFMAVSSYGLSTKSSGVVKILKDLDTNITNKHVLIVEDIIDTGLTLKYLKEMLSTRGPASVSVCALLDKPSRRKVDIEIEYKGIGIPDMFVVGYGLDYSGKYRNLPDVCVLKSEIYSDPKKA